MRSMDDGLCAVLSLPGTALRVSLQMCMPPSTATVAPVMNELSAQARNST
jgi:hypothetical protein